MCAWIGPYSVVSHSAIQAHRAFSVEFGVTTSPHGARPPSTSARRVSMKRVTMRRVLPLLVLLSACAASSSEDDFASGMAAESVQATAFQPTRFQDIQTALGGTIPFPPKKLIGDLLALESNSSVTAAILPHGRSLARGVTDFRAPRTTLLWQDNAGPSPYRLFIGYTPSAEELEIIAWNWPRRQFDFLIVADYAEGKTPRMVRPPRALCMACHPNGGPTFARAPWSESTANGTIRDQVLAQSEDPFSRYLLANGPLQIADRVGVRTALYDLQVRNSTKMLQSQKVCDNACGGDLECRKGLLLAALFENIAPRTSANLSEAWRTKMSSAMRTAWPNDGFAVMDGVISDRSVDLTDPQHFDASQDPLRWGEPSLSRSPSAGTGEFLPTYVNCWSFSREDLRKLRDWGASRVDSAMATEQMTTLVKTWRPSESAVVSTLAEAVNAPRPVESPTTVPWVAPADPTPNEARPKETTTELYNDYCAYCHMGPRPQALPFSDLAALSRYVGSAGRTVRSVLNPAHPIMPPAEADQPTVEELQQMLSDLPAN